VIEPIVRTAILDARLAVGLVVCGQHLLANTPLPEETVGLQVVRLPNSTDSLDYVCQRALREIIQERRSEIVLLLGDRFELLSVAEVCTLCHVPLAHCSGGERTFGAFDDQIRDAITKLSHLHMVSHEQAFQRLVQLQEEPWRIAVAGNPGLDGILADQRLTAEELEGLLGIKPSKADVVVAFHPVTRAPEETTAGVTVLSTFAESFDGRVYLSTPNGDPGSDIISKAWRRLSQALPHCYELPSLGARPFRSLVHACGALLGNSSAGICETPSLGIPSLDLGTRQRGRIRGKSVLTCTNLEPDEVRQKVQYLMSPQRMAELQCIENPYGDGHAVPRILDHICRWARAPELMEKV
jgi:UDP-hydrolysing UDP-N-acetyl-D-glucosamine 2-epimerase